MPYPSETQAVVLIGIFSVAFYLLMYLRRREWQNEQDRIADELLKNQLDKPTSTGDLVSDLS